MVAAEKTMDETSHSGAQAPDTMPAMGPETPLPSSSPESSDLSNKTILALVVLTLVVSFIGAWASISQVMLLGLSEGSDSSVQAPSSEGKVGFSIERPPAPMTESASGLVAFSLTDESGTLG